MINKPKIYTKSWKRDEHGHEVPATISITTTRTLDSQEVAYIERLLKSNLGKVSTMIVMRKTFGFPLKDCVSLVDYIEESARTADRL